MGKSILRFLGVAAILLFLQITFVNALSGSRGISQTFSSIGVATASSANSPPPDAFASGNGSFDILIARDSNYHLLIDTAEGRVWRARYDSDLVSNWRRVDITPAPSGGDASPGRFRVFSNFDDLKETFLLDTLTGHVYLMALDAQQNLIFRGLPVEGQ